MALFPILAIAGLAVNMFFSHIAYRFYLPTVLGLSAAATEFRLSDISSNWAIHPPVAGRFHNAQHASFGNAQT